MTRVPDAATRSAWRGALPALTFVLAWILFWYWDTARAMVVIWARSETFTHAFIVPPISLWLIWRQRHALAGLTPTGWWPALSLALIVGFGWLMGELTAVNAVTQLALVSLLVLAVVAVLGWRVAWAMAFPLAYLFFAVPIGEFVMPRMMEWTADFTVRALMLTGIPVYREGQNFIIPSGSWSVVEACSGVRYLIASVVVGTLYAYLNYRSLRRRLIFIGVSILVPIVANWLRAYMIVMLGHLSGNRLAVGVDHLIYGWLFFGVVILLMFVIGARWAEHPDAGECVGRMANAPVDASRPGRRVWPVAVLAALVTVLPHLGLAVIERQEGARGGVVPPLTLDAPAGWQAADVRVIDWRPAFDNPRAEVQAEFVQGERRVGVFVGYYRQQDYEHKLVSSENVLVKTSDKIWLQVAQASRLLALGGQSVVARTAELRNGAGQRLVAWQWYWIGGRLTSSDHVAKLWQAFHRLRGEGDDSAVVVVYSPKGEGDEGAAALDAFVASFADGLDAALRRTR